MFHIIVTHNGVFHADDAVAVAALRILSPAARIVRTRDAVALEAYRADPHAVMVDVGLQSDRKRYFDHHQAGGAGYRVDQTPYASAGLVWAAFGQDVVHRLYPNCTTRMAVKVANRVDHTLIRYVDAADTGYTPLRGKGPSISSLISSHNPPWFLSPTAHAFDDAFEEAVEMAAIFLTNAVASCMADALAQAEVRGAERLDHGTILVLSRFCPWQNTPEVLNDPDLVYAVYPGSGGGWMVQQVPVGPGAFQGRKPLPGAWAGLRDGDLAALTGVGDATFCHNGCFIAGAQSQEGAVALARLALAAGS